MSSFSEQGLVFSKKTVVSKGQETLIKSNLLTKTINVYIFRKYIACHLVHCPRKPRDCICDVIKVNASR